MKALIVLVLSLIILLNMPALTLALRIERPDVYAVISKVISQGATDCNASVGLGIKVHCISPYDVPWCIPHVAMNLSMVGNTREGLDYGCDTISSLYDWMLDNYTEVSEKHEFTDRPDDWGTWVGIPSGTFFKFYGGEYANFNPLNCSKVWVCTNGFISLDRSNSTGSCPAPLPCSSFPNGLIAPLWTGLRIDNQSKIVTMCSYRATAVPYFVVIWKDAYHRLSGLRLTFAVAIELFSQFHYGENYLGSQIYMAYQNVSYVAGNFTFGIEDHEGIKGIGANFVGNALSSLNGKTKWFTQNTPNQYIKHFFLEFRDENYPNASYYIISGYGFLRGYNMRARSGEPQQTDPNGMFLETGMSAASQLAGRGGAAVRLFGDIVGWGLVAWDLYELFAYLQYSSIEWMDLKDSYVIPGTPRAYVKVPTEGEQILDAALDVGFVWVFNDTSQGSHHKLNITATLEYGLKGYSTGFNVTACTNIEVYADNNNTPQTADPVTYGSYGVEPMLWLSKNDSYDPEDYYSFWAQKGSSTMVELFSPPCENFDLYLYTSTDLNHPIARGKQGSNESVGFKAGYGGAYFIKVGSGYGEGFYNMTVSEGAALSVSVCDYPPGGGTTNSTPQGLRSDTMPLDTSVYKLGQQVSVNAIPNPGFVFTFWTLDGGGSYTTNPISVTMNQNHNLTAYFGSTGGGGGSEPCPDLLVWNGTCYLSHGIINIHNPSGEDVVKEVPISKQHVGIANYTANLVLVEGWPGLNFSESVIDQVKLYATDRYGNRYFCPLIKATHSREGNVTLSLLFSDDWKSQILLLEKIDLTFLTPYPDWLTKGYTFVIEGCNRYKN